MELARMTGRRQPAIAWWLLVINLVLWLGVVPARLSGAL